MTEEGPMKNTKKPEFIAFTRTQDARGQAHFTRVGAAWTQDEGEGINLTLDAMPFDRKIYLRQQREETNAAYEGQRRERSEQPAEPNQGPRHEPER